MPTPFKFKNADNTTVDFEDYYVRADYFRSGNLWAWGGNVGDNTSVSKSSPVQTIAWGSNWKQVACGSNHAAAIKTDGTLWTWGSNSNGRLGDNTTTNRSSPVQTVAFGTNWKQVSSGFRTTAAINTDGTLWVWGGNSYGDLGDNTQTDRSSPVQTVAFGTNWKQVSAGYYHTAAIKTDGTLWLWGRNLYGQLGDSTRTSKSSPVQTIAGGTNWKQVSAGSVTTTAIKTDGTLWAWGINNGTGSGMISWPIQILGGGTNWKEVFTSLGGYGTGIDHSAAIKTDGTLWLWGRNQLGQLGNNTAGNPGTATSPIETIAGGKNWKQVSCLGQSTKAIKTDGTLWSWGGNVGDNTSVSKSSPVQTIAFGTNWKQVAGGTLTAAAIQYQDDYQ
jgi:alpha-tubulin suppressor-like RCC1 family protein